MRNVEAENDIHQWEKKAVAALLGVLSLCFTAWAAVVWNGTQGVVTEMRKSREEDAAYRIAMERRITVIEQQQLILSQRQGWVIENMRETNESKDIP